MTDRCPTTPAGSPTSEGSAPPVRVLRVHLADAPTDVLVWLVERPSHLWWSVGEIAAAVAPDDADHAEASVAGALWLLRRMGYVVLNSETRAWAATADGQQAVEKGARV